MIPPAVLNIPRWLSSDMTVDLPVILHVEFPVMPRVSKHLTASLVLFAMLGAQVFGLQRGYVCLCSDELVETAAAYCEDKEECCDHEHEKAPPRHAPLTVKHEAEGKTSTTPVIHAPVLLAILEFHVMTDLLATHLPARMALARPPPGRSVNPPAALLVAECKVLLV